MSNLNFERLEPQIAEAARLMEMLSHPARLRILCTMLGGEKSVHELAINASLSQPAMSHHLRKLRDSELVNTRRDKRHLSAFRLRSCRPAVISLRKLARHSAHESGLVDMSALATRCK